MPRKAAKMNSSAEFKAPSGSMLDESNQMSYLPDGRNSQADYYRLQNRDKQLAAVDNLSPAEQAYVLGVATPPSGAVPNAQANIKAKIQKIHEKDLIELRALVYLQSLPDTSPELIQLKSYCGCDSREQIASYIADKQIKKLFLSQIEALTGGSELSQVYKNTIVTGATAFKKLFE